MGFESNGEVLELVTEAEVERAKSYLEAIYQEARSIDRQPEAVVNAHDVLTRLVESDPSRQAEVTTFYTGLKNREYKPTLTPHMRRDPGLTEVQKKDSSRFSQPARGRISHTTGMPLNGER